ncbi:MAG: hypothetical protein ABI565_03320, partial [Vicinamibacteria bacterium]
AVFMVTSITLAVLKEKQVSVLDAIPAAASPTPGAAPTNVLGVPLTPSSSPAPGAVAASPSAGTAATVAPAAASPAPSTTPKK